MKISTRWPVCFASALDSIGNTPLIALDRIYKGKGHLLAKMEFAQPGGSVKDRAALRCIQDAYRDGRLRKGQCVVEMTSGNMGAGLAIVCAVKGNPFVAVISEGNSPERVHMLRGLGAEVVRVPQRDGIPGKVTGGDISSVEEVAKDIARKRGGFYVDQFHNESGILAHEEGTGPEIWEALDGELDAFVACVGSGGTFIGTSRFLKKRNSRIYCIAVEPQGAEVLAGKPLQKSQHSIQGTSYGFIPPHWDQNLADGFVSVSDQEVFETTRDLAVKEGLFAGFSSGANVCAAIKILEGSPLGSNATVVTLLCDTGLKYSFTY